MASDWSLLGAGASGASYKWQTLLLHRPVWLVVLAKEQIMTDVKCQIMTECPVHVHVHVYLY